MPACARGLLGCLPQADIRAGAQHLVDSHAGKQNPEPRQRSGKGRELTKAQGRLSLTLEAMGNPGSVAESGYGHGAAAVEVSCPPSALAAWLSFPGPGVDTVDPD